MTLDGTFKSVNKKKRPRSSRAPVLLLAFDPVKKREIGGYIAAGEKEEELIRFLLEIKSRLPRNPTFSTLDFKSSGLSAVKKIFPNVNIIICTFHAEKLLMDGFIKEFNR
ncbi:MAG: hypothetical protein ACTSYS_13765 [Promethearchaeota archaeon]